VNRETQHGVERFSIEEVGELIDLAARLDELSAPNGLSFDELLRVADEVGISRTAIERAVFEDRAARRRRAKRARKQVRRRMRFIRHASVFAIVVAALALIDALGGGGWWFYYVAAIWGAALALQGMRFFTRRAGPLEQTLLGREIRQPAREPS
jgi:2TM domain